MWVKKVQLLLTHQNHNPGITNIITLKKPRAVNLNPTSSDPGVCAKGL